MSTSARWRLVLGRYADAAGSIAMDERHARMDRALEYLYGREYRGRGVRERVPGTLDPSQVALVDWLGEVRELFPRETIEVIERHALERYGLKELVTDPQTLERLEPNEQLLRTLLAVRGHLHGQVLDVARRIIRRVVDDIRRRLEPEVRQVLVGRINRLRHSPLAMGRNFDAAGTVRRNLRHYDRAGKRLVVEQLRFFQRNTRRLPWDIILCVDQSGSMADSVIHSAVMAGILAALPAFRVRLVVFDTSVVDLTDHADDPVETLMRVQLGGGTDIGQAVRYCARQVAHPHRTVFVLVSDFCEGAAPGDLVRAVAGLGEARVKLLGLAALDRDANPHYDHDMADRLAACGMEIAALTPQRFARWLVGVVS